MHLSNYKRIGKNILHKATIAILLLAFTCWLAFTPAKTVVSQETSIHEVHASDYVSEDIVIKNNAIEKPQPKAVTTPRVQPKSNPKPSGTPAPLPSNGAYSGRNYSKEEVQQLIRDYSAIYKIDPSTPLCIARMESGYNQFSKNRHSTASGVFQYLTGTWRATDEGRAGMSVWDADANVKAAVKYMAIHKRTSPWVVAPSCPKLKFL